MWVRRAFNILTIVLTVLLSLLLLFNVITYVKQSNGEICPTVLGLGIAVVETGSMEPNISVDDLVVFVHKKEYHVREVVVYEGDSSKPITHRIISSRVDEETGETLFVTQGDANTGKDPEFSQDQIGGKVVMVIPGVGEFKKWLQSPFGFFVLMMGAILLITVTELLHRMAYRKKK